MALPKLPENSTLIKSSEYITTIKNEIDNQKSNLSATLIEKGESANQNDSLTNLIEKVNKLSPKNQAPVISEFHVVGKPTMSSITVSYKLEDAENQIVRHYISVSNMFTKKDITKDVGYEHSNKIYTYVINGLDLGTNYTIDIFCSDGNSETTTTSITAKTETGLIYGVKIDESNSNPHNSVIYIDACKNYLQAHESSWGDWQDKWPFKDIRPVGFSAGKVVKEINKNDFSKYTDGSSVGSSVDVMIEFPKIYWKIKKVGENITVQISDKKLDESFICPRHTVGDKEVSHIYIGAYPGWLDGNSHIRSVSGKPITLKRNINFYRARAQANGTGYQQMCFYPMVMLQILYLILYKNLNSQARLGQGRTTSPHNKRTGTNDKDGMLYGSVTDNITPIKFLGIENLYGNTWTFIDGYFRNSNGHNLISRQDAFNNTGERYMDCGVTPEIKSPAIFIKKTAGTSKLGFIPTESSGSETTHYCDIGWAYNNNAFMIYGGSVENGTQVGIFAQRSNFTSSTTWGTVGSRLVYLG